MASILQQVQPIGLVMQNVIRFNYFTFKICASQLQFYARRLFGQKENYFVINCAQIIEVTCNVVTEVCCIRDRHSANLMRCGLNTNYRI